MKARRIQPKINNKIIRAAVYARVSTAGRKLPSSDETKSELNDDSSFASMKENRS